jgi:Xaa-Pro aminopeptidase
MQITRRARLAGLMGEGIAVLPTSPELARNADTQFPYRFDSSFHYLSGFGEPEAVLVLFAGDLRRSLLFCRNKDVEREIWDGFRYGPDAAREQFGFDEAYPIDELDKMMPSLLENQPKLYATLGADPAWDSRLIGWLNEVRSRARTGVQAPKEILDLRSLVHEMRLFKDESELATMRRAGQISRDAHARAMRFTQPGQFEYQVEAELIHEFYRNGSRFPAYTSIVAGGANACVLHYVENNAQLRDGDLRRPFVCFTLDDAYRDNLKYAYPVFKRYGIPFTIYAPTDYLDGAGDLWWLSLEHALVRLSHLDVRMDGVG